MKKYVIMLVMLFTMNVGMFAEDNNVTETESFEKYDFKVNNRKLANYLDLSSDQMEVVEAITDELSKDMEFAFYENTADVRDRVVANTVQKNIKHMHFILTDEQYKKYLKVFNATLANKGIKVEQ